MVVKAKVDIEALKDVKGNLSDEEQQKLGLEAIAEAEEEEKGQKPEEEIKEESPESTEKEGAAKTEEELLAANEEDLNEEEKTKKKELVKAQEDELVNAKEEDLDEEKKARRTEIIKARETEAAENSKKEVEAYAKENSITVEEARTELESIAKIQEKYKGDPKQLARANLHIQRLYTKAQEEAKALKDAKPSAQQTEITNETVTKLIEDGKLKLGKETATRETIIEAYRKDNAEDVAELSDEGVFKLAVKEIRGNLIKSLEEQANTEKTKLAEDAKVKREEVLGALPEADKKYLSDLKPLLEKVSDSGIMGPEFNIQTYIQYVKGKNYDADVKEAEDRGYKRGKEEAVISRRKGGEGGPPAPKAKRTLTAEQEKRAMDMYGENMSKEESIAAYIEYLEEEEKNK